MTTGDVGFDGSNLDPGSGYTLLESVLLAVIAGILSFLTIAGNVLVMVSFKLDKQLQTISNYFLLSLAGELLAPMSVRTNVSLVPVSHTTLFAHFCIWLL